MKRLNCLLLLLTLVACGPAAITTPTVAPSPSSTPAPTVTSTTTPMATSTPVAGAPIERCAEILPAFPEGNVPAGTLVVKMSEGLSLLNFRQQTTRIIPGQFWGVGTSPNGKWLSYVIFTPIDGGEDVTMDLVVESTNGEKQATLPFDPNWQAYGRISWLDNERLWFPVDKVDQNPPTLLLNPFTGEQQTLLADYPNFNPYYIGPGTTLPLFYNGVSNVAYDRSLRFVVYPLATNDSYTALLDRETGQTVAKIYTGGLYGPLPLWLPDGRAVLVSAVPYANSLQEWWIINLDGEISQLTHIGNTDSQYEFGEVASLSPDGRYLAFGISHREPDRYGPTELFILNLQTLEVINTCTTFIYEAFWSLDSRYIAMLHWNANKKQYSIIMLDVKKGWAVTGFTDDKEPNFTIAPKGWLDSGK